jgi:ribulose-5-phosphate 4-epimerase/fuculose-1-phosphate aldolase
MLSADDRNISPIAAARKMTAPISNTELSADEIQSLRVDLAAALRLTAQFDWHGSVGNHFSAAVSSDGRRFLMNPRWRHFGEMRASDLMLLDAADKDVMTRPDAPDPSAWTIHGSVHRQRPEVRVMLHCHPPYATALASLKNPDMKPIEMNRRGELK